MKQENPEMDDFERKKNFGSKETSPDPVKSFESGNTFRPVIKEYILPRENELKGVNYFK